MPKTRPRGVIFRPRRVTQPICLPSLPLMNASSSRQRSILDLADQCVKCGLCLPHCPTYRLSNDEGESPRGRISLLQGLALEALEPTDALQGHIDRCLGCRACEAVCPAGVEYGALLETGRAALAEAHPPNRRKRLALALMTRPGALRVAHWLGYAYRRTGLRWLARTLRVPRALGLERLERRLPALPRPQGLAGAHAARGTRKGRVGLFTGCVGRVFEQDALRDAITILTTLGYDVVVPAAQRCCGALHLHAGMPERAQSFANANRATFADAEVEAVLFLASGCGAQLSEYDRLGSALPAPVRELGAFLVDNDATTALPLAPLSGTALVHEPCTLRNVVGDTQATYRLLSAIPDLKVAALPDNHTCCGAAGSYMIEQPAWSDELLVRKTSALGEREADWLTTTNVGCAVQLAAGFHTRRPQLKVVHPVQLLARQLSTH